MASETGCTTKLPLVCALAMCLVTGPSALGQFISGSDGTDGVLDLTMLSMLDPSPSCAPPCDAASPCTCTIDLGLAINGTWDTTPGSGDGVYDATQWAVVFKYNTIDVPAFVTVKFKNHPKNPPVVWLAQGNVTIEGVINLNGENGNNPGASIFKYAQPGPGGFEGGVSSGFVGTSSDGFGPGGGRRGALSPSSCRTGGEGGYGSAGFTNSCTGLFGETYGILEILPLIGGSGGAGSLGTNCGAGGAGGGAILIATTSGISGDGAILARSGVGGSSPASECEGGWGSGGAIRLVADNISGALFLGARSGGNHNSRSLGRIRVEAVQNTMTTLSNPLFPLENGLTPHPPSGTVFPPSNAPTLEITSVDMLTVSNDPDAGIDTIEASISSTNSVTIEIAARNIPFGTVVEVQVTPERGDAFTVNSAPLVEDLVGPPGSSTTTATVPIPAGRVELQLRAGDF